MLEIKDLHVEVEEKEVLKGIDLTIKKGETHALMGPNACGKTTLVLTILGFPSYRITKGGVFFEGKDLSPKDISERARLGIALAYQSPPEVRGVKMRDILKFLVSSYRGGEDGSFWLQRVGLDSSFLSRELNVGFSGGEKKRAELAQVFAGRPKLMILDEPDSGVDIDSLKLMGNEIRKVSEELESSTLVITHHRHILQYLKVDECHIMQDGKIIISGEPGKIIPEVEELGYEGYLKKVRVNG